MYSSILVPLDGTAMAQHALLPAADIARRVRGRLWLVVVHPFGPPEDAPKIGSPADEELRHEEATYLEALRASMAGFGVPTDIDLLPGGDIVPALTAYARDRQVDLVVGATRGRGAIARFVLGDTALQLAHDLRCPMLLLKPTAVGARELSAGGPRRLAVALDGSTEAECAIDAVLALSPGNTVECLLVKAVGRPVPESDLGDARQEAERYLARVAERLKGCGHIRVECQVRPSGDPAAAIRAAAARWRADVLALATRDRSASRRALLGSIADKLVRTAPMPVLVCHAATAPPAHLTGEP